ncbi:MAG: IS66 family transposase, partial [Ruthenibacterium sp.]
NQNGRVVIPDHLEREDIYLDIPESEKKDKAGNDLMVIGEDITEQIAIQDIKIYVKRYHRTKYASNNRRSGEGVRSPELPAHPLNRCKADISMITWLLVNKYINYLPLYRQAQMLKKHGIEIAPSTLSDWTNNTAEVLKELWEELKKDIFKQDFLNVDDTRVDVLFPTNKSKTSKRSGNVAEGRLWCYRATQAKMVWFDFSENWSNKSPLDRLENYSGFVQSDGYSGYRNAAQRVGFTPVGCWTHARRKFIEANVTPNPKAQRFILLINMLYRIEHKIHAMRAKEKWSADELFHLRRRRAQRVMDHFFREVKAEQILPKSPLGRALTYAINQEKPLRNYVLDGRITPDNNAAEQSIRPITIARKNFLFVGSPNAGTNTAVIFSLAECCRANNIDFSKYLNKVLPMLAKNLTPAQLRAILPHNIQF